MPSVIIGGDVYPGIKSTPLLGAGNARCVFNGLTAWFENADLCLANLEGPLTNVSTPIDKIGPLHAAAEACIIGLKSAGIGLLNLGNNHIMDQGQQGLDSTIRLCEENGLAYVGAGKNLEAAGRPIVKTLKGVRVGFLSYAEHEFGMADSTEPGANPLNLVHFSRTVAAHRTEWDHLVVLVHGGNEYYPYPRPDLRELCQFLIDQGAKTVVCQHSHCAGCYESYQGGHIVYGQGNLVFDERSSRACEQEGFLVALEIAGDGAARMRPLPFFQSPLTPGPDTDDAKAAPFLRHLEERSQAILEPGFVEQQWKKFCRENSDRYLSLLQGYGWRVRQWDRRLRFLRFFRSKKQMQMWLQLLRCESHRAALIGILKD